MTSRPRVERSIATVSLSGTLEEKVAAAARAGFDGVEIFENDLIACRLRPSEVRSLAADLGVRIVLYQPFRDFEAVPEERLAANLRRAEHKFAVMTALGTDTMLVCSNVSAAAIDDDGRAAGQLRQLASQASDHGIRIAFEALAWGRHISGYARAWQVVAAADHPHLGICLDSFHVLSLRHDTRPIRALPAEKVFFLQLADAPVLRMDPFPWSRHHRCFPGQGGFDLTGFISDVLACGYRGPWSLEVFNDVFRQADPERTARDGMRSLLTLEESLGNAADAAVTAPPPVPDGPHASAGLPAPASLPGYAFVELAVDELLEPAAGRMLQGLGFARTGRHRSKSVELWHQAGARILVNRSGPDVTGQAPGDAAVTAIAMESADPGRSASRARALLAPPIPRSRGPGEADLAAVAAPDGTAVFFCHTPAAGAASAASPAEAGGTAGPAGAADRTGPAATTGWLDDFELEPRPPHAGPPLLGGVDHVALSQPFNCFDEATLFYRSLLGMRPTDSAEIASPYGLVRSRALRANDGGVRLVLNVPLLGGGRLPETAAAQHVAFTCADIFAVARAVRSAGIPTLPVPANYYDDLAARFDLDTSLITALHEHGVLYDRDEHGGEFFHLYTVTLGRRLFFEIVQRTGGYDGYGAPNTAVRMAAQLRHAATGGLDLG